VINDVTFEALHVALRGLSARERVIADNISNLETPRFLAGKVDFESSLKEALATGRRPGEATISTSRSLNPTRENGNNVIIDEETVQGMDTSLRYELAVNAVNAKFRLLRSAIGPR